MSSVEDFIVKEKKKKNRIDPEKVLYNLYAYLSKIE